MPRRFELWAPTDEADDEMRDENEMDDPESRRFGQNVLGSDVRYRSHRIWTQVRSFSR